MLVSFTGAQCTGKTTLLKACKRLTDVGQTFDGYKFVDEVTRKVMRQGHEINLDGNNLTQLFILNEHLVNHTSSTRDVVLDRCILDGYVYTSCLSRNGNVSRWITDYALELLHLLIDKLDVIFYTQPEDVPLIGDGVRSVDINFRQDIINRYEDLFAQDYYWMDKVIRLSGTIEDRMEAIEEFILKNENSDTRQLENI